MGSIGILTVVLSREIGANRQRGRKGKGEGGRGRGRGRGKGGGRGDFGCLF